MSNARDSAATDAPQDINKASLYGEWLRNMRWRDDLHKKAAFKSMDIPGEEMINAPKTSTNIGVTWKEIAAAGVLGLGGWWVAQQATKPETPPVVPAVQQAGPVDSEYDVIFYDKDGNKIDVPHISKRTTQ